MKVTSYSKLRQNLAKCMDEVTDDHAPMLVTRANGRHAVLMSLEDFASYEETRYLMSSPANATQSHSKRWKSLRRPSANSPHRLTSKPPDEYRHLEARAG
jgi:antitoxin YefM